MIKEKDIISKTQLRNFGVLIGFMFPFIFGFLIQFISGSDFRYWTILIGALFLIFGLALPKYLINIYKFWMKIGEVLGFINSHIILGLVYFIVLCPIAFLMKFFGHDPLNKKFQSKKSYYEYCKEKEIDLTRIF